MTFNIQDFIGETTAYDKKAAVELQRPKSWLKSVSAFANGDGGTLLFGLQEDNTLVGIEDVQHVSEKISELIKSRLDPIPVFRLAIQKVADKNIIILDVEKGFQSPYFYVGDGGHYAFVRVGNESVPADAQTLKRLSISGMGTTFDVLFTDENFSDYERETIALMKSLIGIDLDGGVLGALDISPDSGGPTRIGGGDSSSDGGVGLIDSGSTDRSSGVKMMSDEQIVQLADNFVFLENADVRTLSEIKKSLSKIIRQLEKERILDNREYYNRTGEIKYQIQHYKHYLKYVKGMLNLENILVDTKKYMQIYEIMNERDPHLMSFITKGLLENLTINIKPLTEKDKGGVANERDVRQPQ